MDTKAHAILMATGRDRIGVADDLATALADRKIDIEHSRMTALSGQFALLVHVHGEHDEVAVLRQELAQLRAKLGFHVELESIRPTPPVEDSPHLLLEIFSRGPSGLNAVTAVLKRRGINIQDLETDAYSGSWTSSLTFYMKAHLTVPPTYSVDSLTKELREIERKRRLEIAIKPVPADSTPALKPTSLT